ncbi:MAG TPA: TerB family tellurite resistance protein, partial [Rhodothermales bacterium]|nr:TerB family tellurite resistance protein [Rhodothermales bacterium]
RIEGAPDLLDDLALLALVVAHGTDGRLHREEVDALLDHLRALEADFGSDAEVSLQRAAHRYERVGVDRMEDDAVRLGLGLDPDVRERAFAALVAIAEADGVVHKMEATLLRHVAHAWGIDGWHGASPGGDGAF